MVAGALVAVLLLALAVQTPGEFRWGGDAEGGSPFVEADPQDPSRLTGFDVEIADGSVVLTGSVKTREDRWRAEEIAEECFGVKGVRNELKVTRKRAPGEPSPWTKELENTRFPLYPFD